MQLLFLEGISIAQVLIGISGSPTESHLSASFRESLIMLSQDFLLEQIVTEPARYENILDLCFVSHPSYVCHSKTIPGLSDCNNGLNDHNSTPIIIEYQRLRSHLMDYITQQHGYNNEPKHKNTITYVYNHVRALLYIVNQLVTTFLPFKSHQDEIY